MRLEAKKPGREAADPTPSSLRRFVPLPFLPYSNTSVSTTMITTLTAMPARMQVRASSCLRAAESGRPPRRP